MIFSMSRETNLCSGLKPFDAASRAKEMLDVEGPIGDAAPSQNSFCPCKTSLILGQLSRW